MPVKTVTNTSDARRRWDTLQNAETGRTLELDPGESAECDVPEDFEHPRLKVVPAASPAPFPINHPTPVDEADPSRSEP